MLEIVLLGGLLWVAWNKLNHSRVYDTTTPGNPMAKTLDPTLSNASTRPVSSPFQNPNTQNYVDFAERYSQAVAAPQNINKRCAVLPEEQLRVDVHGNLSYASSMAQNMGAVNYVPRYTAQHALY